MPIRSGLTSMLPIFFSEYYELGAVSSSIMCPATPEGTLASMLRKEIGKNEDGSVTTVTEQAGLPVSIGLYKKDPFADNTGCKFNDNDCIIKDGIDCFQKGIVYARNTMEPSKLTQQVS